jgi:hypothetical protein
MAIVFFHPLIILLTIGIFGLYFLNSRLFKSEYKKHFSNTIIIISAFSAISFITWYFSYSGVLTTIKKFFDTLFFGSDEPTIASRYTQVIVSSKSDILTIINYIKCYGAVTLYLLIICLCLSYVIYTIYLKKYHHQEVLFSSQVILGIGAAAIVSFLASIVGEPHRAIALIIITGIILSAICFDRWLNIFKNKKMKLFVLAGLFICISFAIIFGIMVVYESPWSSTPSKHMSYMDKAGLSWFLTNRLQEQPTYINYNNYRKFEAYTWGYDNYYQKKGQYIVEMIPTHFGYLTENHLDSVLKNPQTTYLISHEKMRQFIFAIREDRRDRFDSYNEEDFFRLNTDNSVQSVYKNKEFEIWIIQPYKAA